MSDGPTETVADVAQIIEDAAVEIVETTNSNVEAAREVAEILTDAAREDIRVREMDDLRTENARQIGEISNAVMSLREDLSLCQTTIQTLTEQVTLLTGTLAASIPAPSPNLSEVVVVQPVAENPPAQDPENLNPPSPESPPAPPKPKRRLI